MQRLRGYGCAIMLVLLAGAVPAVSQAHDGEVHDAQPAPVALAVEPRFATATERVELTAVLSAEYLWLFVAHPETNAPWAGLEVEVEGTENSLQATAQGEGVYRLDAGWLQRPGRHALIVTLRGDGLDELLSGELQVPEAPDEASKQAAALGWPALAGLALLGLLTLLYVRRR
jgi:hypothetical protein